MPPDLRSSFEQTYHPAKEEVLRRVYKEPLANVYLASHARFLSSHPNHPFIMNLLHKGMSEFVETNVMSYAESASVPVHFVGSIAWHFRDTIKQVLTEKGLQAGLIIQKPITGLTDFFMKG